MQKWNSSKRNSSKETKSREFNTLNPLHQLIHKDRAILYTSKQLNQMEQQTIINMKRQSYIKVDN